MPSEIVEPPSFRHGDAVLGIDLGTTNTVAALVVPGAAAEGPPVSTDLVRFGGDETRLLSALHLGDTKNGKGPILVGDMALARAITEHSEAGFVGDFKRFLGCSINARQRYRGRYVKWFSDGHGFDPEDAAAVILSYARAQATQQLRNGGRTASIRKVVVGVPARATQSYRLSVKAAGQRIAGFDEVTLVPEPVAACWAYAASRTYRDPERVLLIDIGAGTTDLTLVDIDAAGPHVLLTTGDNGCGGNTVDREIMRFIAERHRNTLDPTLSNMANARLVREFKEKANASPNLYKGHTEVMVFYGKEGKRQQVSITGNDVHECAMRVAHRFDNLFLDLLLEGKDRVLPAQIRKRPIEKLVFVGGACQTRAFLQRIAEIVQRKEFGPHFNLREPFEVASAGNNVADSYKAVARGLAIIGGSNEVSFNAASRTTLYRRLAEPIGIGVANADDADQELPEGVLRNSVHFARFTELTNGEGDWKFYSVARRHTGEVRDVTFVILTGDGHWVRDDATGSAKGFLQTAQLIGDVNYKLFYPRDARSVRVAVKYRLDGSGVLSLCLRDMGGDDLVAGKTYPARDESDAEEHVLRYEQLSEDELQARRERLSHLTIMRQFTDEVVMIGPSNGG